MPFYDATLLCLWDALAFIGVDRSAGTTWGSLFKTEPGNAARCVF
jgi:hypothetical protein